MNDDSHLYEGEGGYDVSEPKSEAELERNARICLATLNECVDTDVCCFGYAGAWARMQLAGSAPRMLTADQVVAEADEIGLRIATHGDEEWPTGLDDLSCHAPSVLAIWIAGEPLTLREPVTITGARAATAYGLHVAEQMALDLAKRGHTIVTGLSHGIDAAVLKGALAAREQGGPAPVAVLASGIAEDVPPRLQSEENLVRDLLFKGTVITERPPGAKPTRVAVHERSRILAAMSAATVVIEGSPRSSTRLLAQWAGRDLGRVLCAVPGPVTSVQSQLPHHLVQTGLAQLVTSAADVIEALDTTTITDREVVPFEDPFEAMFDAIDDANADNTKGA